MIAAATGRPTAATLATDFAAFKSKLVQLHVDLASPALRNMYAKTASATWTMQKIQARIEVAVLVVAALKDKGIAALFSVPSAMTSLISAIDDIKALPQQVRDAFDAAHAAHPDVVRVEHDAVDLASTAAKLALDLKSVGVW